MTERTGLEEPLREEIAAERESATGPIPVRCEPPEGAEDGSRVIRRVARNTLSLTGANLASSGLTFLATAYLARILTAEGFGILGFAQAAMTYFTLLINMGFAHYGVREIARRPGDVDRYVNNIVTIRTILAAVSYALLFLFAYSISKPFTVKAAILILGLKLFSLTFNLRWVFQGKERMGWIAVSRFVPQLFYAAAVFLLVEHREQVLRVPALQVASTAAGTAILLALYLRSGRRLKFSIDMPFWREIFRQSIPMAASYVLNQVYVNFDMIFLGFTHGEKTVGFYHAANRIVLTINMFGTYYFFSLFPNLSRIFFDSREKLQALVSNSIKYVTILLFPVAVGGTVLAGPIIRTAFGSGYAASVLPLQLLIWNVVIINIRQHYSNTLIACNLQKRYMYCAALGAATNIVLNMIFIPRFGMPAAACTTIFSELVVLASIRRETGKIIKTRIWRVIARPLAASLAMGGILLQTGGWNIFGRVALGASVYFPLLFLVGGLSGKDIRRLSRIGRERNRR